MTVGFRADAETINGTAGTSVVVNRPAGTADGDVLVAFITGTGTPTISTPAGWTLLGTETAGTAVRAAAFWKVASSEPASWTWTLGSSVRNGGWVGAFTGVDLANPITEADSQADTTAGTTWLTAVADVLGQGAAIGFAALTRTASGSATTHTTVGTERADQSTNGGSGTDLSYAVTTSIYSAFSDENDYFATITSSQSCTNGALWAVTLAPAFIPYDGGEIEPIVEAAFGADPDDPEPETNWVWTDISDYVREDPGVSISKGRANEQTQMGPTNISFSLLNDDGRFTPGHPTGAYYPDIRRRLPVRVSVPAGYGLPTELATGFVESLTPGWDVSLNLPTVDVQAYGRLAQVRQGDSLRSAMYRTITDAGGTTLPTPIAYWPMEDGSGATLLGAERGGRPISVDALTRPAADSDLVGSAPLPTLDANARMIAVLNANAATSRFGIIVAIRMDAGPPNNAVLFDVYTTGTVNQWRVYIAPASPDTINLQLWDHVNNVISLTTNNLTESVFYGGWRLHSLTAIQDGADIDWEFGYHTTTGSTTQTGTTTTRTLGAVTRVVIGSNAVFAGSVGHLAVFTGADWDASDAGFIASAGLDGNSGELVRARFLRLLQEQGVPRSIADGDLALQMEMGPQPTAALDSLLQEIENADQAVIHDGGLLGKLVFVARNARYNKAVDLALDMGSGHIAPGWTPQYDTSSLRTESTVSRTGGSSATYVGDQSEGRNKDTLQVNHPTDEHLENVASWRVATGSTPGMRTPKIQVDLRRNPDLVEDVLAMRVGESRLTGTGLPSEYGPQDVDGFVEGYSVELANFTWKWTANLSPAAPYDVGIWEDDILGRADTAGSQLGSGIDADDTSLSVATTSGPIWITPATKAAQIPFNVKVGGEVMAVDNVGQALNVNPFLRVDGTGWTGQNGTAVYSTAVQRRPEYGSLLVTPNGAGIAEARASALLGGISASTTYLIGAWIYTPGAWASGFRVGVNTHNAGGTLLSTLQTSITVISAGTWTWLGTTITTPALTTQARLFASQQGSPTAGDIWYTTGLVLIPTTTYTASPQTFTVTRSVNGVVKSHLSGAAVRLATPMIAAL